MLSLYHFPRLAVRRATVTCCRFSTDPSTSFVNLGPSKKDRKPGARSEIVTWANVIIGIVGCSTIAGYLYYLKWQKKKEQERDSKRALGKVLIGGPWELVNHDGKLTSWEEYLGKWTLIYFGFTHCPDVCPDEIEKMVKILDKLESRKDPPEIRGLFFTVDAERDSTEIVKKYILEFSPKLMGFTGSKEQIDKVAKTFRVYFSHGPKDQFSDYMVDHTIIIYLVDPDGKFVDYFGQRTSVDQVVSQIEMLDMKRKFQKKRENGELSLIDRIRHGVIA